MLVLLEAMSALIVLGVLGGGGALLVSQASDVRARKATAKSKEQTLSGVWEVYTLPHESGGMSVGVQHASLGRQEIQVFTKQDVKQPDFTGMLTEAELAADMLAYQLNSSLLRQKETTSKLKKRMRDS
jgi:hypothetical protein